MRTARSILTAPIWPPALRAVQIACSGMERARSRAITQNVNLTWAIAPSVRAATVSKCRLCAWSHAHVPIEVPMRWKRWFLGDSGPKAKVAVSQSPDLPSEPNGLECAPGCSYSLLADGICDPNCNTSPCGFDMFDCEPQDVMSLPAAFLIYSNFVRPFAASCHAQVKANGLQLRRGSSRAYIPTASSSWMWSSVFAICLYRAAYSVAIVE